MSSCLTLFLLSAHEPYAVCARVELGKDRALIISPDSLGGVRDGWKAIPIRADWDAEWDTVYWMSPSGFVNLVTLIEGGELEERQRACSLGLRAWTDPTVIEAVYAGLG